MIAGAVGHLGHMPYVRHRFLSIAAILLANGSFVFPQKTSSGLILPPTAVASAAPKPQTQCPDTPATQHAASFSASQNAAPPTIVIDSGHGEWNAGVGVFDPGSIYKRRGQAPVYERDLNMLLAQAVKAELTDRGYRVTMTHTTPNFVGKGDRHMTLVSLGATDLNTAAAFISIHHNEGNGSEIIYNGRSAVSRAFARNIGSDIGVLARPDVRDLAVLRNPGHIRSDSSEEPAILYEAGSMSSAHDRARVLDPDKRQEMAASFADAVIAALPRQQTVTQAPAPTRADPKLTVAVNASQMLATSVLCS